MSKTLTWLLLGRLLLHRVPVLQVLNCAVCEWRLPAGRAYSHIDLERA